MKGLARQACLLRSACCQTRFLCCGDGYRCCDRFYRQGQRQKKVLVVVTCGWSVLCFDHNVKKLWETNLQIYLDPFEEIGKAAKSAEEHRRSASEKEESETSGAVDLGRFAFYAFAGKTGVFRWSRNNEIRALSLYLTTVEVPIAIHLTNPSSGKKRRYFAEAGPLPAAQKEKLKRLSGRSTRNPLHKPEEHHPPGKDTTK